jgi:SPX domain protein involved in polyphosphate accumulation
MRFGKTLREAIYPPWKDQYVDYSKLKTLLREDGPQDEDKPWTEDDEARFCEEILNVQLEKVAAFQELTFKKLEQRTTLAGDKLKDLAPEEGKPMGDITLGRFKELEGELDSITNDVNELKKYSNINYTAFLKIVKKHDRKRGNRYKVRPMLQISLSKRSFNSEQSYAPLLNKLSLMYFIIRQHLDESSEPKNSSTTDVPDQMQNGEKYTAYKCKNPENPLSSSVG